MVNARFSRVGILLQFIHFFRRFGNRILPYADTNSPNCQKEPIELCSHGFEQWISRPAKNTSNMWRIEAFISSCLFYCEKEVFNGVNRKPISLFSWSINYSSDFIPLIYEALHSQYQI